MRCGSLVVCSACVHVGERFARCSWKVTRSLVCSRPRDSFGDIFMDAFDGGLWKLLLLAALA